MKECAEMLETINNWLPVVAALCSGLIFIWRIFNKLNLTLVTLNGSVDRLNRHLNDVDDKATKSEKRIENHEIRIVIIERELGIKSNNTMKGSELMKNKFAALIEVRKIVTLLFALVFCYLAVLGKLSAESVLSILTMVFGFYFAKSIDSKGDNK